MKRNVLLVCGAGISTSIIARLLKDADLNNEFSFSCCDMNSAPIKVLENDLVILAPHVKFMQPKLEKICKRYGIPLFVIDANDYLNGETKKLMSQCMVALNLEPPTQPCKIVFLYERVGYLTHDFMRSKSFKTIAQNHKWNIEPVSVDDYMHSLEVACILIEPQLSYYTPDYFKNRNYHRECPFLICPIFAYQDATGKTMEKIILANLGLREIT